jgi:hypothetical protein
MIRRLLLTFGVAALVVASVRAQETSLESVAASARDKIERIVAAGDAPRGADASAVRTVLTEAEINAYLRIDGREVLPSGIAGPEIRLLDDGRARARAIVDLDAVRRSKTRSWLDPLAYITGSVEVTAAGVVVVEAGVGRARLESATVGGVAVPQSVIDEVLRFYTKSEEWPRGYSLDDPFALPANIRSAVVERERVTIVQ